MPATTALLITGGVLILAVVVGLALRARDGRRRDGGALRVRAEDVPDGLGPGAVLVQFSTEMCARCPQVRRLLRAIADSRDDVRHVDVDLTHRGDLAARYHVLQTPTTFLVDTTGAVLSRWGGVPDRRQIEDAIASARPLQEQR